MTEKIDIKELNREAQRMPFWRRHLFFSMVVGAIGLSLVMVMISMNLYRSSGAAQLDLSRPGYEAVRGQVAQDAGATSFSPTGDLTPEVLAEFDKLYSKNLERITNVDAFSPEVLSDRQLELPRIAE